ncbi:MAG: winged helix-turn-helix domain-containing protein [Candidatus Woesearchaeota archaeon]
MNFELCVYYELGSEKLLDFFPKSKITPEMLKNISVAWENPIYRKILKYLSENKNVKLIELAENLNHSVSTISEAINRLESLALVSSELSFEGKKQRVINSKVLFVTKNPELKKIFNNLINQGIWIDMKKTKQIIEYLKKNKDKFLSVEEISLGTKIPVDEVRTLLENYDSFITRSFSEAFKETPFEKITLYKYKERENYSLKNFRKDRDQ